MRNKYIHELPSWPQLAWSTERLAEQLATIRHHQGRLIGRMEALGFSLRAEAMLQTLTEDVTKSSQIEGEVLDREQVRSSIARRLGIDVGAVVPTDRHVEGVVEMMLDATLTSSKWAVLGKCSQDTALRDLDDLVRRGILVKNPAGGRSTSYAICLIEDDPKVGGGTSLRARPSDATRKGLS